MSQSLNLLSSSVMCITFTRRGSWRMLLCAAKCWAMWWPPAAWDILRILKGCFRSSDKQRRRSQLTHAYRKQRKGKSIILFNHVKIVYPHASYNSFTHFTVTARMPQITHDSHNSVTHCTFSLTRRRSWRMSFCSFSDACGALSMNACLNL